LEPEQECKEGETRVLHLKAKEGVAFKDGVSSVAKRVTKLQSVQVEWVDKDKVLRRGKKSQSQKVLFKQGNGGKPSFLATAGKKPSIVRVQKWR
jgi:hypothetical protein